MQASLAELGEKLETLGTSDTIDEVVSSDGNVKINVDEDSTAVIDKNTVIKVEEIQGKIEGNTQANIEMVGGENAEVLVSYDISLILEGAKVQPGGKVAVTLPAPENVGKYTSLQVVSIDDNGNVTPHEIRINDDGTITFMTDHFSHYAIIGIKEAATGLPTGAIVAIVISSIVVVAIVGFAIWWFVISKKTLAQLGAGCKSTISKTTDACRNTVQNLKQKFSKK